MTASFPYLANKLLMCFRSIKIIFLAAQWQKMAAFRVVTVVCLCVCVRVRPGRSLEVGGNHKHLSSLHTAIN